ATAEDERALGGAINGEVEDHRIYIGDHDFGDAPNSYQTTMAAQGPTHGLINKSTLYIGTSTIDAEADGYASTSATGDNTNGSDDENGIVLPLPMLALSDTTFTTTITLRNSTTSGIAATLVAWLDTNQDGAFSADEVVDSIDYDSVGASAFASGNIPYNSADKSVDLTWNGLSGLTNGSIALRIRLTHDALTANDWFGVASNGEVEDYLYLVGDTDYGDAPDSAANVGVDNYRTTLSDDGARHIISTDLYLGTNATDGETDAASPNTFALGDDNNTGTDDEDGVVYGVLSTTQSDYSAVATITNNSANPAYLYAWIDFDRNGRFDRDEFINSGVITVPAASGVTTETLSWSSMSGRSNDTNIYLRVRLTHELFDDTVTSTTEDPRSYGATSSGEVEDHWILVTNSADKGDLEDTYSTSMAVGGPWHTLDGGQTFIGAQAPDADAVDQLSSVAEGDDNAGTDDEDATISGGQEGDTDYSTTITVTNTTGVNVYLNAWVDWNLNGSFEASEHVTTTVAPADTSKTLTWSGLSPLVPAYYPMRIRLGDIILNATDFVGYGGDGEIEDHRIFVAPAPLGTAITPTEDYGDAPASYGTYEADDGAKHTPSASLFIGATEADPDSNGQPSVNADADDLTDFDDEDNLTIPVLSPSMTTWSLDVPVTNTTGGAATLYAWVDHDADGQFQADEMTSVAVPDGTNNANVT
ncbi:GEVED domain-containing protein, partial [Photobacterium andalusiense]|uniref:GEVED domain-containing protein n=1 Tax=Photobacterium andalusiense TaxID=2204296 RepID=UPI001F302A13